MKTSMMFSRYPEHPVNPDHPDSDIKGRLLLSLPPGWWVYSRLSASSQGQMGLALATRPKYYFRYLYYFCVDKLLLVM